MDGQQIRVGIVGASASRGWALQAHIPALRALPEFQLTAVCTTRRETADASAKAFGARWRSPTTGIWCTTRTSMW